MRAAPTKQSMSTARSMSSFLPRRGLRFQRMFWRLSGRDLRPGSAAVPRERPERCKNRASAGVPQACGEVIRDFSISYVTHGTLNADKSNAVLMVTAIGGNHHRIDYLIGPGKALDPSKYFIIATDAIGNGLTSSPSNSRSQAKMQFPRFNIRDMGMLKGETILKSE